MSNRRGVVGLQENRESTIIDFSVNPEVIIRQGSGKYLI